MTTPSTEPQSTAASSNPYNPPPGEASFAPENRGKRLATRGERLLAAMIDGMFALLVGWVLSATSVAAGFDPFPQDPMFARMGMRVASPMLSQLCSLVPAAGQWALIAASGQSIGKRIVGLCIAMADGTTAGLFHGVVLRALPLHVLAFSPAILQVLSGSGSLGAMLLTIAVGTIIVADAVFVFDASFRCLHDRFAGTWVIALRAG
ncbi:MAG: RDD family protein [Deltaproteobacteria bacterium]